jgi:hypothetical protein
MPSSVFRNRTGKDISSAESRFEGLELGDIGVRDQVLQYF